MSDERRAAQAAADFAKIMADFMALSDSEHTGSFTVHYKNHRVTRIEWRVLDDASRWGERREAS